MKCKSYTQRQVFFIQKFENGRFRWASVDFVEIFDQRNFVRCFFFQKKNDLKFQIFAAND